MLLQASEGCNRGYMAVLKILAVYLPWLTRLFPGLLEKVIRYDRCVLSDVPH